MTLFSALSLFTAMVVLAAIPGPGVIAVMARSVSGGFLHGAVTAIGILLGDYVFIALCLSGLAFIAETMGGAFVAIKYLGAAYLIWMGIGLLRARTAPGTAEPVKKSSHYANLLIGLATTLGNPKAILFYLSFFPAFLPLEQISGTDVAAILAIATLAIGGVMTGYAWLSARAGAALQKSSGTRSFNLIGGGVLIGGGAVLAARA